MTKISNFVLEIVNVANETRSEEEKLTVTASVGARVNRHLVDLLREGDIPISSLIESSFIHFLLLPDEEKVKFIHKYDADKVNVEDIVFPKKQWGELVKDCSE